MRQIPLLRKYGIRPRKERGQTFLIDENIQRKILVTLGAGPGEFVLEIGAGLGALTEGLLASGAEVYAVEKEASFAAIIERELGAHPNLHLINEDFLKLDLAKIGGPARKLWKVVGNIPYAVTTPLLFHLVDQREHIDFAVLTLQKEVTERLLATPGCKAYGRLTLAYRFYADVRGEFEISRNSFTPVPRVDSAVVTATFRRGTLPGIDERLLFQIIKSAFAMRRKNLLNCLSASSLPLTRTDWQKILEDLRIPTQRRAEELLLKDYLDLARAVQLC